MCPRSELFAPGVRVRQVKAAIDDHPARIAEMSRQLCRFDESGEAHAGILQSLRCRARGARKRKLDLGTGALLGKRKSVLLARDARARAQAPAVCVAPARNSRQEHKAPHMLKLNPRGQLPVLKDGDYVCFESLAILYYLDLKYPAPPLFGRSPEEAGTIMRVICEYQTNAEPRLMKFVREVFTGKVEGAHRGGHRCDAYFGKRSARHRRTAEQVRVDRGRARVGARLRGVPGDPVAAASTQSRRGGRAALAFPADGIQLSCAWRAGYRASKRCRATNAPIRHIGASAPAA